MGKEEKKNNRERSTRAAAPHPSGLILQMPDESREYKLIEVTPFVRVLNKRIHALDIREPYHGGMRISWRTVRVLTAGQCITGLVNVTRGEI